MAGEARPWASAWPGWSPAPAPERFAGALAAGFLAAAAVAAMVRAGSPFDHGWWLVAYLALVGGVAQLLLSPGRAAALSRAGPKRPARRWRWLETALWNAGTLAVPVGVFLELDAPVLAGSVLLLAALGLFATERARALGGAAHRSGGWERGYYAVAAFLAGSVVVGAGLAEALPWQ